MDESSSLFGPVGGPELILIAAIILIPCLIALGIVLLVLYLNKKNTKK